VMVGSWPCKVSSEIHINGRRISQPVREDKGKTIATEPEDKKDPKRACVMLSKGHEVVGPGYSRLTSAATKVTDRGENSGNPNRVNQVSKTEQHYPSRVNWVSQMEQHYQRRVSRVSHDNSTDRQAYRVSQVSQNSSTDQQADRVSRVNRVGNTKQKNRRFQSGC
jgi:hypothetical protein